MLPSGLLIFGWVEAQVTPECIRAVRRRSLGN